MMQNNNASIRITTSDTEDESKDRTWGSTNAVLNALALNLWTNVAAGIKSNK